MGINMTKNISIDHLAALILIAAKIVKKFEKMDYLTQEVPFEDEILDLGIAFQQLFESESPMDWTEFERWIKSDPGIQIE
jgi:hypothetical protein